MATLLFLLNLAGGTVLLLFAVRMVQKGIDRVLGPALRRFVHEHSAGGVQSALAGLVLAMALQSATAAALLISGMVASGAATFAIGLAAVLGADLGSALVILVLSFRLDWIVPLLLAAGGLMRLKAERRTPRQIGRILLGIAFVLLALRFISQAVQPIADSDFLPAVSAYLERDPITAFLAGAAVAFAMHSSVAAILMIAALTGAGALPPAAGLELVVGANLGAALLLVWLSRGAEAPARRIPLANLALRGGLAILALAGLAFAPAAAYGLPVDPGRQVVLFHLCFNALLIVVGLPLAGYMRGIAERLIPEPAPASAADSPYPPSALDDTVREQPALAIASVTREVLRLLQMVGTMLRPAMELYLSEDKRTEDAIRATDAAIDSALGRLRAYVASIPADRLSKRQTRDLRDKVVYAINLRTAAGLIGDGLIPVNRTIRRKSLRFSDAGWQELRAMHDRLIANAALAENALVSGDVEIARMLIQEKAEMALAERRSRKNHLKRLQGEGAASFETSDAHLETLRLLREINSYIASVAYPVLDRDGLLLESRLVTAGPEP